MDINKAVNGPFQILKQFTFPTAYSMNGIQAEWKSRGKEEQLGRHCKSLNEK